MKNLKNKVLVVLVDRIQMNIGGQERRWLRIAKYYSGKNINVHFIVNQCTLNIAIKSDISWNSPTYAIQDIKIKLADNIFKNLYLIWIARKYKTIHFSNQSLFLLPAAIILKFFFKKKIIFSYNGTSLNIHKNSNRFNYYKLILLFYNISDVTEILNPRLEMEGWLKNNKYLISPCSFSDEKIYGPAQKENIIVFAGHLYENKGINFLKKIIMSSLLRDYEIHVYGDSISGDLQSEIFKSWLINEQKNNLKLKFSHSHDMSNVYKNSKLFISLQQTSNYPSQSVIEAMYSGCSVLMTNTGDSKLFGICEYIEYIDENIDIEIFWDKVNKLSKYAELNSSSIEKKSKENFSITKYANFLENHLWLT